MSYRKVGGLHFIRIGRLGFSWFWHRPKPAMPPFAMSPLMLWELERRLGQ